MKPARFAFLGVALALFSCHLAAGEPPADLGALRAKAERGDPAAQYNLGLALTRSATTAAERTEAFVWLTLASEGGAGDKTLETVLDTLSPAQAIEVRRRVEAARAAHPALRPAAVPIIATPAAGTPPIISVPGDDKALQEQLGAALKDKSQLAAELTAAWKEVEHFKAQLAQHADSATTIITAQKTIRETQANLARQSSELATARAEAAATRIEQAKLTTQLNVAREQLATSVDAKAKAEIALAAAEQVANARAEDLGKLRAAASAQELAAARDRAQATRELESRVRQLETEKTALVATAAANPSVSPDELARLSKALAEAERKLAASSAAKAKAEIALAAAEQIAAARVEDLGKLRAATSAQELAAGRDRATATRELEARIRQLEAEKAALTAAAAASPGVSADDLARTTKALAEAEGKLATALRSYTVLTTERDEMRGQISDLTAKLAAAEARVAAIPTPAPLPAVVAAPTVAPAPAVETTPTRPTLPASPTARTHVIAVGDTLSNISRRYYGTPNRWTEVLAANRDVLIDERSLVAGKVLRIP